MAGYQPEYLNDGSGSPASPFSPNQPPSFKPNVNRMKTKRWVTAKTYSYDGDDWGDTGEDDIYDAYLDPDTPPEQAPNHKIESQPTTGFPGQQDSSVAQISQQGQPPISSSQGDQAPKPLPFVRPADIYKRLNEERERQRLQTADSTPQPQGAAQHLHAVLAQQASTQQSTQNIPVIPSQELESPQNQNRPQEHAHNSTTGDSVLNSSRNITTSVPENPPHVPENSEITKAKLPELRPFSGFGDTFLNPVSSQDTGASGITQVASPESGSQEHGLDRRESVGFRSVVHQAFDIPETPATDTSSVARSNSETTSVISPIIRSETHSLITGDRTPTIPEEQPLRPVTPASEFKPGHRRSLTPPSANNSPARRPMITTGDPIPRPESACTLVPTPTEPQDGFQLSNDSEQVQQKPVEDERPTVKTASSYTGPVSQSETDSPSSTHSTDTSELNRRLQDDIIRSLTPNPAVGHREYQSPERPDDGHTSPRLHPESSLVTSEYQEYFAQQPSLRPSSPPAHHINPPGHDSSFSVPSEPDARPSQTQGGVDMPQPLEYNPDMSAINVPQHSLKKKFSWEMDFDEVAPPVQAQPQDQHAPAPAVDEQSLSPTDTIRKVDDAPPNQHVDHPVGSPPEHPSSPSPDNIQAQPAPGPGGEVQSEQDLKTDLSNENSPSSPLVLPESLPSAQPSPVHGRPEDTIASPISDGQKLLGFREIMAFKSPEQKISAFSRTRDQFAAMESGLQDWLKQTSATHPEHGDIVQQNGNVPQGSNAAQKAMPSRAKFPKLSSGSGSSRVHIRHASATPLSTMMHTQQVQAKGKDLLHSAGVLGGKAGDAAKGFFAKGRNKFRHSGSADKDQQSPPATPNKPKFAPAFQGPSASTREDETNTLQNDLLRIRSLKLDQAPLDVSFDLNLPARKSSVHSVPDNTQIPAPWADNKARPMSSPTQDRTAGEIENTHSGQDKFASRPVNHDKPGFSEANNHVSHPKGSDLFTTTASAKASSQPDFSHHSGPNSPQTTTNAPENSVDYTSESLALRPQSVNQERAKFQGPVTSPTSTILDSPKYPSTGANNLDIAVSHASTRGSRSSEDLQVLVLTPNGLELIPEPDLSSNEIASGIQDTTDAQSARSFAVSKPPSPSPPEDTISKGIEEQILSRKFSFEEGGEYSAEIEQRLVSVNGVHGGSKSKGLHQPSPIKATSSAAYLGADPSAPNGLGARVQHARYSSVPTIHPAHQISDAARRMSMPMNGIPPAESSKYAAPQNVPTAHLSASSTPRSSFQNTRSWGGGLQNRGAGPVSKLPPASNTASPSSTPPKSRSRLSLFISRFHTSSSSKVTSPSPLQIEEFLHSKPQVQPQPQRPVQQAVRPAQQPAQHLAQQPMQQSAQQPAAQQRQQPVRLVQQQQPQRQQPLLEQQQQHKQPGSQTNSINNRSSRLNNGTVTPSANISNSAIQPANSQTKDAADAKKKKGLKFLRRFSYNGETENAKRFTPMGIKSVGGSQKPSNTASQNPAPSISSRVPFVQLDNLQSQMAAGPGPARFYQTMNPTLAKIAENPSADASVNSSQRTSLQASTVNGRYHSQQAANMQYPPANSGSITAPPSVYTSNNRTDYFTTGMHERSQSFHAQPRRTASSQVHTQNSLSTTATSVPTINLTPSISHSNQQHPLTFNFPPNTQDRLAHNSSPSKQSDISQPVDASQYPLPESRVLSPVNSAMTDLPPPPPPKIPLNYAYPSATAPSPIRIFSAPARQQYGIDTSVSSTVGPPPATHSLPPPQLHLASLGLHNEPVELPTHDDSSEEIMMSSTAYPGQEWQPDGLGNWD